MGLVAYYSTQPLSALPSRTHQVNLTMSPPGNPEPRTWPELLLADLSILAPESDNVQCSD